MTSANQLTNQPTPSTQLSRRLLIGGAIGLVVILNFLLRAKHPKPEWGEYWMIQPLIITPLAGAAGGLFSYIMDRLRYQRGWNVILTNIISFIAFIIAIWMGIVLGLHGTMWN